MIKRRVIALIAVLALVFSLLPTAYAQGQEEVDLESCRVLIDGDGWKMFILEDIDTPLTTDSFSVSVVFDDGSGKPVDESLYELKYYYQIDYTDEGPVLEEADEFGIRIAEEGFSTYCIKAVARDGAKNETVLTYFDVWNRYSFNYYGAQISFGDNYKEDHMGWRDYYRVPETEIDEPEVRGIDDRLVSPEYYEITYYRINTEAEDFEDRFSTDDPMTELPAEPGSYFLTVTGKAPYFGEGSIEFDIVVPQSYATSVIHNAYDGETLYVPEGGDIYVKFDLDPYNGMIPGWRNDLFKQTGFGIDDDPTFFEDDDYAYAHIYANDKQVGEKATLYYNWYRVEDIFGENAPGWIDAVPVYSASVVIEVAEQPQTFAFVYGDNARYFDGDTIYINEGDEILLSCDLTYYTDWWLPGGRDLSELYENGFTVDDELISFEETGFRYNRISAEGLEPGTKATVYYKWYSFDDAISGDLSDKEAHFPAAVTIEVAQPEPEPVYLLGDADLSGDVSILDATAIQRYLAALTVNRFSLLTSDSNRNGETDILDATIIQRWLANFSGYDTLNSEVNSGTYYALWNMNAEVLPEGFEGTDAEKEQARAEIRRALSLLIDRRYITEEIVNTVKDVPSLSASTFVSKYITDADGKDFSAKAGSSSSYSGYYPIDYAKNTAAAREILAKYFETDESGKFVGVPELTYIHNYGEVHASIANKIRNDFADAGVQMTVNDCDWNGYLDTLDEGNYSIARNGWIADYNTPMEFLNQMTSYSEDNSVGFGKGENASLAAYSVDLTGIGVDFVVENGTWAQTYDALIAMINSCEDITLAYKMMHAAEDLLMSTGCIIPLYYY